MSLYRHVGDKDQLLDAMADAVVDDIERPPPAGTWPATLRATIMAARATMLRHPWAATRPRPRGAIPGPATLHLHGRA